MGYKMDDLTSQQPHRRRQHYNGTHPHTYAEKYKELHPEQYPETVQKVIAKGSTPAGMHLPIAVEEILSVLRIKPGENGLDCTLGYGGHTRKLLGALGYRPCGGRAADGSGHLTALDIDRQNMTRTESMLRREGYPEKALSVRYLNFAEIDRAAAEFGVFDFVLADLGVSSMQIDDPSRGFSYKREGPLDLRLDASRGVTAAERLGMLTRDEIAGMLQDNADEPYAEEIAVAIMAARKRGRKIETTTDLRELVAEAVMKAVSHQEGLKKMEREELVRSSCARTFQAIRIDINQEYESLYALLEKLPEVLNAGGRAAILTFHSGEDRMVKKMFRQQYRDGLYEKIAEDAIRPSAEECRRNPRARSAKLRWAVKASE